MKKGIIGFLIGMGLVLAPTSYAKADTQLDMQYKEAYNSTMNVASIGQKYEIGAFKKVGHCDYDNLIKAIREGNFDKEILKARDNVNNLPSSIQIQKNTLSEIVDNYQHQIYYQIISQLNQIDYLISEIDIFEEVTSRYVSFTNCQRFIIEERELIENIKNEYKCSYRTAIDQRQQSLLNRLSNFVSSTEYNNEPCFKYYAVKSVEDVYNYTKNDKVLQDFIKPLLKKANSIDVGHVVSDDEILKFALNNGFKEASIDESSRYKGEKAYKVLMNRYGESIEFYKDNNTLLYKYKKLNEHSRKAVLEFFQPNMSDLWSAISYETKGDAGGVAENGFLINLTPSDKEFVYDIYRCCYNE